MMGKDVDLPEDLKGLVNVFVKAKFEVLELMRDDSFIRFVMRTPGIAAKLANMEAITR